jgi:hypothetical protein
MSGTSRLPGLDSTSRCEEAALGKTDIEKTAGNSTGASPDSYLCWFPVRQNKPVKTRRAAAEAALELGTGN